MQMIPSYSIEISSLGFPFSALEEPDQLKVVSRSIIPAHVKTYPFLLDLVDSFAKDYFFHAQDRRQNPATARMTFSPKTGIQILSPSDPVMNDIFIQHAQGYQIARAEEAGAYPEIERLEATAEMKEKYQDALGEGGVFLNYFAIQFAQIGLKEMVEVDISAREYKAPDEFGYLRFPHMLSDMFGRFNKKLNDPSLKIFLAGSGGYTLNNRAICYPQFLELAALFQKGQFALLGHDHKKVKTFQDLFSRGLYYDPFMLNLYTLPNSKSKFCVPKHYQDLFEYLKKGLSRNSSHSNELKPLRVKLSSKQVKLYPKEINTCRFREEEKGQFDVVVATLSLLHAIQDQIGKTGFEKNHFEVLFKFIELLKEDGSLYVDSTLIAFFGKTYGEEATGIFPKYFEALLGNKLKIEEIPLSDFSPDHKGLLGFLPSGSMEQPEAEVSSCSITVLTRTGEKINLHQDEKREILLKMVGILKKKKESIAIP